jgi:hypothetical protein
LANIHCKLYPRLVAEESKERDMEIIVVYSTFRIKTNNGSIEYEKS